MLIDWFTVWVQIVNFLILVMLLNRFLFKPIRGAIARREKSVADALNRAEQAENNAQARVQALEDEKRALETIRERLMDEARDQVAKWREDATKNAREDVETLRRAWIANMTRDRQLFLDGLKTRMVRHVVCIGEKVLRDLADQRLNQQVTRVFLEKIAARKDEFNHRAVTRGILVQSGFALDDEDARTLRDRLAQWFPETGRIRFESEPGLGLGIQLVIGDRKATWHLNDYLKDLETEIMENLFSDPRVKP